MDDAVTPPPGFALKGQGDTGPTPPPGFKLKGAGDDSAAPQPPPGFHIKGDTPPQGPGMGDVQMVDRRAATPAPAPQPLQPPAPTPTPAPSAPETPPAPTVTSAGMGDVQAAEPPSRATAGAPAAGIGDVAAAEPAQRPRRPPKFKGDELTPTTDFGGAPRGPGPQGPPSPDETMMRGSQFRDVAAPALYEPETPAKAAATMASGALSRTFGAAAGTVKTGATKSIQAASMMTGHALTDDEAEAVYDKMAASTGKALGDVPRGLAETTVADLPGPVGKYGAAALQGAGAAVESLAGKPEDLAVASLMGVAKLPKAIDALVGLGFGAQMWQEALRDDPAMADAVKRKDWPKVVELAIPKATAAGLGTLSTIHGLRGAAGAVSGAAGALRPLDYEGAVNRGFEDAGAQETRAAGQAAPGLQYETGTWATREPQPLRPSPGMALQRRPAPVESGGGQPPPPAAPVPPGPAPGVAPPPPASASAEAGSALLEGRPPELFEGRLSGGSALSRSRFVPSPATAAPPPGGNAQLLAQAVARHEAGQGGEIKVERQEGLTHDEKQEEERWAQQIEREPDKWVDRYNQRFTDPSGTTTVNVTNAKLLHPGYSRSAEDATRLGNPLHAPAAALADEVWRRGVAAPAPPGKLDHAVVTIGPPAGGKTSGLAGIQTDAKIINDTHTSDYGEVKRYLDEALNAGNSATVLVVYRELGDSIVNGVLDRANRSGKVMPLDDLMERGTEWPTTVERLRKDYAGKPVDFAAVDNSRGRGQAMPTSIDDALAKGKANVADESGIKAGVAAAAGAKAATGEISPDIHSALLGSKGAPGEAAGPGRVGPSVLPDVRQEPQPQPVAGVSKPVGGSELAISDADRQAVEGAAQGGEVSPQDLSESMRLRIAARGNIRALVEQMEHTEQGGGVGRRPKYSNEQRQAMSYSPDQDAFTGISSPVPKEVQGGYRDWNELRSIIDKGLSDRPMTDRQMATWNKLEAWAVRKDGPVGPEDLAAFLSDAGSQVTPRVEAAPVDAERAAIQSETGDTSFQPEETPVAPQGPGQEPPRPPAGQREATSGPEASTSELDRLKTGEKAPITELSPEASERQRLEEERDQRQRTKPIDKTITPTAGEQKGLGLYLSEDTGKPGAQRDLLETPATPKREYEGGGGRAGRANDTARTAGGEPDRSRAPAPGRDSVGQIRDDLRLALNPAIRGDAAKVGSGIIRQRMAESDLAIRRMDQRAQASMKLLNGMTPEERRQLVIDYQSKQWHSDPDELAAQQFLKAVSDHDADVISGLTGRARDRFYENYFPGLWKKPSAVRELLAGRMEDQPRRYPGASGFLKAKKYPSYEEALAAGLDPKFENPVEAMMQHHTQVMKWAEAVQAFNDLDAAGLRRKVYYDKNDKLGNVPFGWVKAPDYLPNEIIGKKAFRPISETVDRNLYEGLRGLADDLGIPVTREPKVGGPTGWAEPGTPGKIWTKFASPMGTLTHEIGHHLDWKYGLWDRLQGPDPDAAPLGQRAGARRNRAQINNELRALADLRFEGHENDVSANFRDRYVRTRPEKMANMVDAFVNAPDKMKQVAPHVYDTLKTVIGEHPELEDLGKMGPSLVRSERVTALPPIDKGKLVQGYYYMPPEVAKLFDRMLTPGLEPYAAFRGFRYAGNLMNGFQLGLSAFHAGTTAVNTAVGGIALGMKELLNPGEGGSGVRVQGLKDIAGGATVIPKLVQNLRDGRDIQRKAFGDWNQLPVEDHQMIQDLLSSGARFGQDRFHELGAQRAFSGALQRGEVTGVLKHAIPAALEAVNAPILRYMVPWAKLGAMMDLVKYERARLGPDATPEQLRYALQRGQDSVDYRMGQVIYDNRFWNRTVKDLGMAGVRSLGWSGGTIAELGGAGVDAALAPGKIARKLGGQGSPMDDPIFTHRMAYTLALPMAVGTWGALYQYLRTGKGPEEMKDYFFPKNGRTNPDGSEARDTMPSYMKDVVSYGNDPLQTLANKMHPMVSEGIRLFQNKDFYGTNITNPDDPAFTRWRDRATYGLKTLLPFSVRNAMRQRETGGSLAEAAPSYLGITPAPRSITQSPAEHELAEFAHQQQALGGRTKEQAEHARTMSAIESAYRRGNKDEAAKLYQQAVSKGIIGEKDDQTLGKRVSEPPIIGHFRSAPIDERIKVYGLANESQRQQLRPIMAELLTQEYARGVFDQKPERDRQRILGKLGLLVRSDPKLGQMIQQQEAQ